MTLDIIALEVPLLVLHAVQAISVLLARLSLHLQDLSVLSVGIVTLLKTTYHALQVPTASLPREPVKHRHVQLVIRVIFAQQLTWWQQQEQFVLLVDIVLAAHLY